jgi:predicted acyl esterase
VTYRGFSDGVTFLSQPLTEDTEISGPIAVKLFVSSATADADLFVVVRAFTPDFKEVTFQGHIDPHTTIAQGWLRASHRKLDMERTLPYRPYHTHDEIQKLTPHEVYELDIEVWPTCVVLPTGHRIALSVRGKDYAYPGDPVASHQGFFTGVAAFRHDEPSDRPPAVFDADVTIHCGQDRQSYVLLPIIPPK